jgi:hypothetical protein
VANIPLGRRGRQTHTDTHGHYYYFFPGRPARGKTCRPASRDTSLWLILKYFTTRLYFLAQRADEVFADSVGGGKNLSGLCGSVTELSTAKEK